MLSLRSKAYINIFILNIFKESFLVEEIRCKTIKKNEFLNIITNIKINVFPS